MTKQVQDPTTPRKWMTHLLLLTLEHGTSMPNMTTYLESLGLFINFASTFKQIQTLQPTPPYHLAICDYL